MASGWWNLTNSESNDSDWTRPVPAPAPGKHNNNDNNNGWTRVKPNPTPKPTPMQVNLESLYKPSATNNSRSRYVFQKQSSRRTKRQNNNETKINTNLSRISSEFKPFYKLFINRYSNSLKYAYSTTDSLTRANQYLQSITSYINEHTSIEKLYRYDTPYNKIDVVSQLMNSVFKYKNSLAKGKINKHSFVNCHGGPTFVMKTVPKGYTLVMITPHNRLGIQNSSVEQKLLKMMQDKDEITKFMNDPICYDKQTLNGLFSHSSVYFENQFYFDIFLGGMKSKDYTTMAIYNYNNSDDGITKLSTETMFNILLSELLETGPKKIEQGIIFVNCCRDLNESALEYGITNSTLVTRYEHLLKIINQSTFIGDNTKKYETCYKIHPHDRDLSTLNAHNAPQQIKDLRSLFGKIKFNSPTTLTITTINKMIQFFSDLSFSDRSLSTSINILDRLDFEPELIDLYASINMYSNHGLIYKLMTQYFNQKPDEFKRVLTLISKPYTGFNIDPFSSYLLYKRIIEKELDFDKFNFSDYNENQILYFNNFVEVFEEQEDNYLLTNCIDALGNYNNLLAIFMNDNNITHLPIELLALKKVKLLLLENNPLDFSTESREYYNITKKMLVGSPQNLGNNNKYIFKILQEYSKNGTLLEQQVKKSGTLKNILTKYRNPYVNFGNDNDDNNNRVRYRQQQKQENNNAEPRPTGPEEELIKCKKCGKENLSIYGSRCSHCGKLL